VAQKPAWLLERTGFEPSSPVNSRYFGDLVSIRVPRRKILLGGMFRPIGVRRGM
jgi:hypothetical protein